MVAGYYRWGGWKEVQVQRQKLGQGQKSLGTMPAQMLFDFSKLKLGHIAKDCIRMYLSIASPLNI